MTLCFPRRPLSSLENALCRSWDRGELLLSIAIEVMMILELLFPENHGFLSMNDDYLLNRTLSDLPLEGGFGSISKRYKIVMRDVCSPEISNRGSITMIRAWTRLLPTQQRSGFYCD